MVLKRDLFKFAFFPSKHTVQHVIFLTIPSPLLLLSPQPVKSKSVFRIGLFPLSECENGFWGGEAGRAMDTFAWKYYRSDGVRIEEKKLGGWEMGFKCFEVVVLAAKLEQGKWCHQWKGAYRRKIRDWATSSILAWYLLEPGEQPEGEREPNAWGTKSKDINKSRRLQSLVR